MKSFRECLADAPGTIYYDQQVEGIRILVLRGPVSLCAYLGVPLGHPLADESEIGLDVHGGLTFGGVFSKHPGWHFVGWDYGHAGDATFYDLRCQTVPIEDHQWSVEEVVKQAQEAASTFTLLVRLSERIADRVRRVMIG